MKINTLTVPYAIKALENHTKIKDDLLCDIEMAEGKYLSNEDEYYTDNIAKYDWHINRNSDRPWVKKFEPLLRNEIRDIIDIFGFSDYTLAMMWYQQYLENGTHGWHTHSDNYTGVYYLEMPECTPQTQIVNPLNHREIINLDVREGDIVLFPSFIIHRAPINKSNRRKTIISFDINAGDIKQETLNTLMMSDQQNEQVEKLN